MNVWLFRLFFGCCLLAFTSGCKPASDSASPPAPAVERLHLLFTYGSEKEDWVKAVTADFNARAERDSAGKVIEVEAVPKGSGELIDDLISGDSQAHLASPASAAFIRLGNAQSRAKTGKDLLGPTENLLLSPVVIAMWKPMAEAIGWGKRPVGWSDILALASDERGWAAHGYPQWGTFKFGHTHPEYSNSGLVSLFAEIYAANGKVAGLTAEDIARPETAKFLGSIENSVVHYGSSTGFFGKKMFGNGPQYLSAAVLYENMVIESYGPKYRLPFPMVAIYPREGAFWSDHPVAVVERPWVTPEHREAAKKYIDFLLAKPQQERAMQLGFRPSAVDLPLAAPIDLQHGVDPQEPKTTLEVPSTESMDAILHLWRAKKKHSSVALVFDTSGSMQKNRRLENARIGATEMLRLLGDDDRFTLVPFSDKVAFSQPARPLREMRSEANDQIQSLFPGGSTALYDAILAAYEQQERDPETSKIKAIVVLTDGEDTSSKTPLAALLKRIQDDQERNPIRIFTIGYDAEAKKEVLQKISDATQAKFYAGTPENIREVFRDISTFF